MNYLLSASLAMAIFYALYVLAFRRLRFHALNRAYLLAALGVSLVIPLVELPALTVAVVPPVQQLVGVVDAAPVAPASKPMLIATDEPEPVDWEAVAWIAYVIGVAAMALRLGAGLARLAKLARQPGRWEGGLKLIPTSGPNASFFNRIFLNETGLTAAEREQVLAHEAAHARLGHSADRLALEILRVVFWFNPVLWLYQRSLAHLHELQADAAVAHRFETRAYARLLLHLHGGAGLPVANLFSRQPLKDRLAALFHPKPTSSMKKLLYLAVVPVALAAILALAQTAPPQPAPTATPTSPRPSKPNETALSERLQGVRDLTEKAPNGAVSCWIAPGEKDVANAIKRSESYFRKAGFLIHLGDMNHNAQGELTVVEIRLTDLKRNRSASSRFDAERLRKSDGWILVAANAKTRNMLVTSRRIEPHSPLPAPKSERQGKVMLKAPIRVAAEDIPTPAIEPPAGHLVLENGRATMYLNLNRYDPAFIETAKRFFQSNGAELRVENERVDASGKWLSGAVTLRFKGSTAQWRIMENEVAEGVQWVYLDMHQKNEELGAGRLPTGFRLPSAESTQTEKASLLPSFLFWPFKKPDGC